MTEIKTKINKNHLIEETAVDMGVPVSTARKIINSFCENIEKHILDGDEVSIKGLVHFYEKKHREKEVQDFETMERTKVGERVLPCSKLSRTIIDKYKNK